MRRAPSRLAELGIEGVIIVLSILAAFGLESWWQDRVEESALTLELQNVLDEFQGNLDEMEVWLAAHERAAEGAAALAELCINAEETSVVVQDTLAMGALIYASVDPSLGALRTLIASGRVAEVRDAELRVALASWESLLEDIREEEVTGRDLTIDRLWPLLLFEQDPAVSKAMVELHDAFWRAPHRTQPMPSKTIRLVVSDGLATVLIVKASVARQTVNEFRTLLEVARAISRQLRGELGSM